MRKLSGIILALLIPITAVAFTLPYTFTTTVPPSQANGNFSAVRDEINAHEALTNAHNTTLEDVLTINNSVGSHTVNFNNSQLYSALVENLAADPTCNASYKGRIIFNTTDTLFKICDGSTFVSIAGSGVNTLQSVLNAGNSAGAFDINLNNNELLSARIENVVSDPTPGNIGRLIFNTTTSTLAVDTGAAIQAIGGAQGLASVLGVSNSAGSTNLDMNGQQVLNLRLEQLASDPGTTYSGRMYYNTTSNKARFYNGTSWNDVGNTNTLAQTMALGNSVGSNDLNMNGRQVKNALLENLAAPPGTGNAGRIWYDTVTSQVQFETSGSNKTVATLDDTQTLTNKTISGSSNTISNIQDSSLSANVELLNTAQTISAKKTFSTPPVISKIETPSGAQHTITDGLANDTFVLANAVQTLAGKTLNAPALSGNMDFNLFQATEMVLENRLTDPTPATPGRIYYKSSTGEVVYDTGTEIRALTSSATPSIWTTGGNSGLDDTVNFLGTSDAQDLVMKANNAEILRLTAGGAIDTNLGAGILQTDAGGVVSAGSITNANLATMADKTIKSNISGGVAAPSDNTLTAILDSIFGTTQGAIIYRGAASWGVLAPGISGQFFQTQGAGADPQWAAGGTESTTVSDTNSIDMTLTGSDITADLKLSASAAGAGNINASTSINADGLQVQVPIANGTTTGVLSSADWTTFNNKQAAGNYLNQDGSTALTANWNAGAFDITAQNFIGNLTGDVTGDVIGSINVNGILQSNQVDDISTGNIDALDTSGKYQIRLTGAAPVLRGIANGVEGKELIVINASGASVNVANNNANPLAGDKILTGTGADLTLADDASIRLVYDATDLVWRVSGGSGSGGGSSSPLTTKGDLWGFDTADARVPVGVDGTFLASDSSQSLGVKYKQVEAIRRDISQSSHGFSVGDWVRLSGAGTYTKSQADSATDAEVEGMVSAVADTDNFTLTQKGYVTGLSGLTANTRYFLDDATAGAITSTAPTTAIHVSKYVFVADSTTSGYVDVQPGRVIESQASNASSSYLGYVTYAAKLNCIWSTTSATFGNFAADADCNTATVSGLVSSPSGKTPSLTLSVETKYNYVFKINGDIGATGTSTRCVYRVSDGTDSSEAGTLATSDSDRIPTMEFNISPTSSGSKEYHVQAIKLSGTNCNIFDSLTDQGNFRIDVYRFLKASN